MASEVQKEDLMWNVVCETSRVAEDNDSRPDRATVGDIPGPELSGLEDAGGRKSLSPKS